MLSMLVAWDAAGRVVATLAYKVIYDETKPDRPPLGLVDFEAHELAGGQLTDVWNVSTAVGSGTWPEWLGVQAHGFRVELADDGPPGRHRVRALVHRTSGHRRERSGIAVDVATRLANAERRDQHGRPVADLTDLIGSPQKPLRLDEHGRNAEAPGPRRPTLPLVTVREG